MAPSFPFFVQQKVIAKLPDLRALILNLWMRYSIIDRSFEAVNIIYGNKCSKEL
jgi:hypothetical protein